MLKIDYFMKMKTLGNILTNHCGLWRLLLKKNKIRFRNTHEITKNKSYDCELISALIPLNLNICFVQIEAERPGVNLNDFPTW